MQTFCGFQSGAPTCIGCYRLFRPQCVLALRAEEAYLFDRRGFLRCNSGCRYSGEAPENERRERALHWKLARPPRECLDLVLLLGEKHRKA